jgi:hypothetical protein
MKDEASGRSPVSGVVSSGRGKGKDGMAVEAGGGGAGAGEPAAGRGEVLCLINEAWFFRSHFLPWAQAACRDGFTVSVLGAPDGSVRG